MKSFLAPLLLAPLLALVPPRARAQEGGTSYDGAAALGLELRRLGTTKRVLMIGAHPDDENTQILSTLALGQGADVAYLSLTRGEGGQNGIGPELQEGLGLIRSEELLAARGVDAARQFFTRAYDFGFSKDAEEAFRHWPREQLLSDVVAVIRHFRPDVIVSVFHGTPRDGHGQHQVAGIMAREGFAAAGDPSRFPELTAAGLAPFAPRKLLLSLRGGEPGGHAALAAGEFDPLVGQSYFQAAMASRSLHRSQDMGQLLAPGPRAVQMRLIADHGAPVDSTAPLFAGIDTTLAMRVRSGGASDARVAALLAQYDRAVERAAREFNPLEAGRIVPALAEAAATLRAAEALLPAASPARFHLGAEREQADAALWRASGLVLDAVADDETVTPGQSFTLTLTLWNGSRQSVPVRALEPHLPRGWTAEPVDPARAALAGGELLTRRFRVRVPAQAEPTRPYFLRSPRRGDLYAWPEGVRIGVPFEPAPVRAAASVELGAVRVEREHESTYREVDPRRGELRRPVRVVPPATVSVSPGIAVIPLGTGRPATPLRFTVRVRGETAEPLAGTLRLSAPAGWRVEPATVPVGFTTAGEERQVEVSVTPPANPGSGAVTLSAALELASGARLDQGYTLVDYPHIRPRAVYRPAEARVRAFEVRVPEGLRVGYIAGAGDDTEQALRQMGVEVTVLSAAELATGDLSRFDAIVTGTRAYEVRPDLVAHNRRLLEYARGGGTVVVQYAKYEYTEPGIAPYPVEMARPHDRITDEEAEVRLLDPAHPALSWPNRIGPADFEGWFQERGLYHLRRWDERFTPLLEMADPGEASQRGILLVAPYGEGTYVYTGLALFRQLPEGVPGAYRLLANLISLGNRR